MFQEGNDQHEEKKSLVENALSLIREETSGDDQQGERKKIKKRREGGS